MIETFDEYQLAAMRTAEVDKESLAQNLVHASLGLATESGEFTSEVKRIARYGKAMTPEMRKHMKEELGDVLWYLALAADALGVRLGTLAAENITKLTLRFAEKYSGTAAEARADKGGLPHTES